MARLLLMGLSGGAKGLSRVLCEIAQQLRAQFDVTIYGFVPSPRWSTEETKIEGCRAHISYGPHHRLSADPQWLAAETAVPPDAIFVIAPAFLAHPLLVQLQTYRPRTKLILYLPVEGQPVASELVDVLTLVDLCLTYTDCVAADLNRLCQSSLVTRPTLRIPTIQSIGHGVSRGIFFPKPVDRARILGASSTQENSFVVLNVNRPYRRKRLDLTIQGFARFAATCPQAILVLYTGPRSRQTDAALKGWVVAAAVPGQIVVLPQDPAGPPLSDEELNDLYNCCDVGLTTSMGEGWGLTAFEHAATGHAQIVPAHTSFQENWQDAALMLPCEGREFIFFEYADMFPTTPEAIAEALHLFCEQPQIRRRYAAAAYGRARETRFSWDSVGRRLRTAISEHTQLLSPMSASCIAPESSSAPASA